MTEPPEILWQPLGDQGLRVEFGREIAPEINARIRRFCQALERGPIPGVIEWVPGYVTVAVYYQPWIVRYGELCTLLKERARTAASELPPPVLVQIPVRYGGADGPDLDDVAAYHGLTPAEVISRHTAPLYLTYLLGFLPGFPYLGGLSQDLITPRLDTPRMSVPAGSVGIGGAQTGVYPFVSPGGWRIIGRTSLTLYDVNRNPASLLQPGDRVQFVAEES